MRAASCIILYLGLLSSSPAATWQLAAGPTRSDGSALEISRSTLRWETALGYVSAQQVNGGVLQDTCTAGSAGPVCVTQAWTATRSVDSYGYLSVQRRFAFRPDARVKPVFGFGVVANSDTNAYVSSPLTFSLSAGLRLGERWSLEWRHFSNAGLKQPNLGQDMLLLRAGFRGPGR